MCHRFGVLKPFSYHCPLTDVDIVSLDPQQFSSHIDSCLHCGAPSFHLRHECVVTVIGATFRYNGLVTEINPKDLPLPGKRKGGPDFVVWGSPMFAGDVCTTCNKTITIFGAKETKYVHFCEATGAICFPFAMTSTGTIDHSTLEILADVVSKNNKKYIEQQICDHTTFACIKGHAMGVIRLRARALLSLDDGIMDCR